MAIAGQSLTDSKARWQPGTSAPQSEVAQPEGWYLGCKYAVDFACALALLVLTLPLIVLSILLVKWTSRGPTLYLQTRLGKGGKPFTILKIRTMYQDCESLTGARWCVPGDSRITPVGRWLRKSHLDELPQLVNVLRGDMSLVGPRPERPEFVPQLEQAIPHYRRRLGVRPGVTGLAQVQLPPDTDLDSVRIKLSYDLYYVAFIDPWLDFRLCWATFFKLCCVPFPVLRTMFGFPSQDVIERYYRRLTPQAGQHSPAKAREANSLDGAETVSLTV